MQSRVSESMFAGKLKDLFDDAHFVNGLETAHNIGVARGMQGVQVHPQLLACKIF